MTLPKSKLFEDPLCLSVCGSDEPTVGYFPFNHCQHVQPTDTLKENTSGQLFYCMDCLECFIDNVVSNNRGNTKMELSFNKNQNMASLILSTLLNKMNRAKIVQFLTFML